MRNLAETFTLLLNILKASLTRRPPEPRSRTLLIDLVWRRLCRMNGRFQRLFAHWQAGTLPPARPGAPRPGRTREPAAPPPTAPMPAAPLPPAPLPLAPLPAAALPAAVLPAAPPLVRLPTGRFWLLREVPGLGSSRGQIQHFLADTPELAAFLRDVPQAGRILRPLCRMLTIDLAAPFGVRIDHLAAIAHPPPRIRPAPAPASEATPEPAPEPAPEATPQPTPQPTPGPRRNRAAPPPPADPSHPSHASPEPAHIFSTA